MNGWTTHVISDVADIYDGPHATPTKTPDGPWYLSISSLKNGRFDFAESAHLSDVDLPKWTKRVAPRPGDTLFSYETRLGESAYWEHDVPAALGRRMGLLRPKPGKVEPRYLSYAYLGPQFQSVIRERNLRGATVDRIPIGEMPSWPIYLPPINQQRTILKILDAIDSWIVNVRRRTEVLEEMARTIYREWFVQRRYPGHEGVPVVDSPLGHIPEDWLLSTVGDIAEIRRGVSWDRTNEIPAGGTPVVTIPNVRARLTLEGCTQLAQVSDAERTRFGLARGDILLIGSNGNPERVGYAVRVPADLDALFASFLMRVRPKSVRSSPLLLYHQLTDPRGVIGTIRATAVGATGLRNLRISALREAVVLLPDQQTLKRFDDVCGPLVHLADQLGLAGDRLTAIRDLLLPRLVTGQIDVSMLDFGAALEAVA